MEEKCEKINNPKVSERMKIKLKIQIINNSNNSNV
jgi:hypothetical protein